MTIDLISILGLIAGKTGLTGLCLAGGVVLLLVAELWIWVGRYGRLSKFRNRQREMPREVEGISVVVIAGDDFAFLENGLPRMMAQTYPNFELVVIEVGSSIEFSEELRVAGRRFENLTTARIDPDPRFRISDKMVYNIGIKTARYNNVVLATIDALPESERWLECVAKGFANGDVVVGYCGVEPARGFANKVMRCSRLAMSVRFLAAAARGHAYRGMLGNMGFRKELYLENRGFNHLDMTIGEDDLFVQKIVSRDNVSVVLNPHAVVMETFWGGMRGWWRGRRLGGMARDIYPFRARFAMTFELVLRAFFAFAVAACAVWMPMYTGMGAVALWVFRLFVVRHQVVRVSRRVGEHGLATRMMLWDIFEPLFAFLIFASQHMKPAREIWK